MTRIKGVDISVYQKGISFSALKQAGVKFAIIRAGYGEKKDYTMDNHHILPALFRRIPEDYQHT